MRSRSNLLRKFLRLSSQERALLLRTVLLMVAVRLGLWLLPFPRVLTLTRLIRHRSTQAGYWRARQISWAVHVVGRRVPSASCLVQALTAKLLLERVGIPSRLHIGVAKAKSGRFEAHAWLESLGELVTGGNGGEQYSPLMVWDN